MRRQRPNFYTGGWLDPDHIPCEVMASLKDLHFHGSGLSASQIDSLLQFASNFVQYQHVNPAPAAVHRDQLESVAGEARRLLVALGKLNPDAQRRLSAAAFTVGGAQGVGFLPQLWDLVQLAEQAADFSLPLLPLSRGNKPREERARAFVAMLANQCWMLTGKWPPKDRTSWFSNLVGELCAMSGIEAGPRIVAGGIDLAKMSR